MKFNDIIGDLTPEQLYALQQIPENEKVTYIAGLINAKMNKDGGSFGDKLKSAYSERGGSMRGYEDMQMGGAMQEPITDVPQQQQVPIDQEQQGMEQGDSAQLEGLITEAAQMLQGGNQPEQVMQFLMEQGLDQEQAQMIVQEIMNQLSAQSQGQGQEQMQQPQQQAPMQQAPMAKMGGSMYNNYY